MRNKKHMSDTVEISEWLRAQLAKTDTSQADLARHIGLTSDKISKVMTGTRKLTAAEMMRAMDFFGLTGTTDQRQADTQPGLSEDVAPWSPADNLPNHAEIGRLIFPHAKRAEALTVTADDPAFCVRKGDVVFFDIGSEARPGDLAIVQESLENGAYRTSLGRWHPPHIITGETLASPTPWRDDAGSYRVLYPVLGSLRLTRRPDPD